MAGGYELGLFLKAMSGISRFAKRVHGYRQAHCSFNVSESKCASISEQIQTSLRSDDFAGFRARRRCSQTQAGTRSCKVFGTQLRRTSRRRSKHGDTSPDFEDLKFRKFSIPDRDWESYEILWVARKSVSCQDVGKNPKAPKS